MSDLICPSIVAIIVSGYLIYRGYNILAKKQYNLHAYDKLNLKYWKNRDAKVYEKISARIHNPRHQRRIGIGHLIAGIVFLIIVVIANFLPQ